MCSLVIISLKLPLNCAPLLIYHMQINHWFEMQERKGIFASFATISGKKLEEL